MLTKIKRNTAFLLLLFLVPVSLTTQSFTSGSTTQKESKFIKQRVKGTFVMSGGCTVNYDVVVDFGLFPPRLNSIHGTVTFSGTCTGTQTFRASGTVDEETKTITELYIEDCDGCSKFDTEFKSHLSKQIDQEHLFDK